MPSKVALVILNWNGLDLIKKLMQGWIEYSPEADICLVDNASNDDSVNFVKKNYPTVNIIQHNQNLGFCEGYNQALTQIKAEYYVLLNSDVELSKNWLQPLIQLLQANPEIAAVQPKILDYYKRNTFEYAGAAGGMLDHWGYPFCRGRVFDKLEEDKGQFETASPIFWASGACMMVKADVFHQIGGLDSDFFAHMEEIDMCWRMLNNGHQIFYCPSSVVYHMGGGTLHKSKPQKTFLNFRNNLMMLHKNLPSQLLFGTILKRLFWDGIAAIKFLLSNSNGFLHLIAILKAHFAYYALIPDLNKKRKHLYPSGIKALPKVMYQKSILLQHFLKK